MATRLVRSVAEFQVNVDGGAALGGGVAGGQIDPAASALSDGRFIIAYQSDRNGTADQEVALPRRAARRAARTSSLESCQSAPD